MYLVNSSDLQTIMENKFPEYSQSWDHVNDLLLGDLDLELVNAEGGHILIEQQWDETYVICFGLQDELVKTMKIMETISNMDDEQHMKLYKDYGKFHDGGDDFDYGGGFVGMLYDLLMEYFRQKGILPYRKGLTDINDRQLFMILVELQELGEDGEFIDEGIKQDYIDLIGILQSEFVKRGYKNEQKVRDEFDYVYNEQHRRYH